MRKNLERSDGGITLTTIQNFSGENKETPMA